MLSTLKVPPLAPRLIPRLLLSVISAVANKVPPFKTIEPVVAELGKAPKLLSAAIDKVPAIIEVEPV